VARLAPLALAAFLVLMVPLVSQDLLELQVALAPLALQAKMAVMASVVQLALAVHVALSAPRETRAWLAVTA